MKNKQEKIRTLMAFVNNKPESLKGDGFKIYDELRRKGYIYREMDGTKLTFKAYKFLHKNDWI